MSLDQRSGEWLSFRAKRIGASDAPIICGHSPWKSALQLWMEKTGKISQPDNSQNFAIQRGIRLEPVVRAMAGLMLDRDFEAKTFTHSTHKHLMASLDGWDEEHGDILEIKVGNKKDHDRLINETESTPSRIIVPDKYYAQLQQQIDVMDAEFTYFASYLIKKGEDEMRGDMRTVKVYRDQAFIDRYYSIAEEFYEALITNKPPRALHLAIR